MVEEADAGGKRYLLSGRDLGGMVRGGERDAEVGML